MLGELIIDVDIQHDIPLKPKCGRCTRCIDVCPTGALVDEYVLNTPKCISFLTIELRDAIPRQLRPLMGDWVFGCDMCQEICPYTNAAITEDDPTFQPKSIDHAFPPLHWLLSMREPEFRGEFSGAAVMRAKWSGIARNAAVALGNTGGPVDLEILERTVAEHPLPLVRGHAAWAMGRISLELARSSLNQLRRNETLESVTEEIDSALSAEPL